MRQNFSSELGKPRSEIKQYLRFGTRIFAGTRWLMSRWSEGVAALMLRWAFGRFTNTKPPNRHPVFPPTKVAERYPVLNRFVVPDMQKITHTAVRAREELEIRMTKRTSPMYQPFKQYSAAAQPLFRAFTLNKKDFNQKGIRMPENAGVPP